MNAVCISAFSTGKEEFILHFKTENKKHFQLQTRFINGEIFFRFFAPEVSFGKRSQKFAVDLENILVSEVFAIPGDRILIIVFQNQLQLVFKGFGRFGNVFLFDTNSNSPIRIFRVNIKSDIHFTIPAYLNNKTKFDDTVVDETAFFQANLDGIPELLLEQKPGAAPIGKGLKALDTFAESYIYQSLFLHEKQLIISKAEKDLKHFKKLHQDNLKRAELIKTRRSFKEIGDIVMSYAHSIKPGVSNAFLTDYFTGNQIRVKLDPSLSAAENAEKYYRKAKNEALELQHAINNSAAAAEKITSLEEVLNRTKLAMEFKDLRFGKVSAAKAKPVENLPYKEFQHQNFTIWLGKNAKSNDDLLKLAAKNDLWLHAKDVAGSHVIIRKSGAHFPDSVIQFAARLAAQNSKAKTQGVVPVYCVERKFVSKGKNMAPGEVKLTKENVVDAFMN